MGSSYKIYVGGLLLVAIAAFFLMPQKHEDQRDSQPATLSNSQQTPSDSEEAFDTIHPGPSKHPPVNARELVIHNPEGLDVSADMRDGTTINASRNVDVTIHVANNNDVPATNLNVMVRFTQTSTESDEHFMSNQLFVVPGPIAPGSEDSLVVKNAFQYLWRDHRPERIEAQLLIIRDR